MSCSEVNWLVENGPVMRGSGANIFYNVIDEIYFLLIFQILQNHISEA
jgi:hypothetical protein